MKHTLYINETSNKNNKYFKTFQDLNSIDNKFLNEIKEHKKRTGFLKNTNKKFF